MDVNERNTYATEQAGKLEQLAHRVMLAWNGAVPKDTYMRSEDLDAISTVRKVEKEIKLLKTMFGTAGKNHLGFGDFIAVARPIAEKLEALPHVLESYSHHIKPDRIPEIQGSTQAAQAYFDALLPEMLQRGFFAGQANEHVRNSAKEGAWQNKFDRGGEGALDL